MGIGDVRYSLIRIVNEAQRKLGLTITTTLSANSLSRLMVDYINDVCNDISDYGNWQETIATARVTAVSGQRTYSIATSANIKNIGDVMFLPRRGALRKVNVDEMRIMSQSTAFGQPSQYCIFGTDINGNPTIFVRPTPGANENGQLFSILHYLRPPTYTTADVSAVPPFPGRVIVQGLMAKLTLDENSGAPTNQYAQYQNEYLQMRKEALNRFNSDTGFSISFTPARSQSRWRR